MRLQLLRRVYAAACKGCPVLQPVALDFRFYEATDSLSEAFRCRLIGAASIQPKVEQKLGVALFHLALPFR